VYLGIDIGSSSSKAVILDRNGKTVGSAILNIGTGSKGPQQVIELALRQAGLDRAEIRSTVVTGYGRMTFQGSDRQITEISCHARGVHHMLPDVRTIIDVGGQDAKVICLGKNGNVENFIMNDKCAAGTGRFLEVMARVLDCRLDELSDLADRGNPGVSISSTCTVFAESEVISQLSLGKAPEDVALGALKSIAQRIAGLCGRVKVVPRVAITGGVALNRSAVDCIGRELGMPIVIPENPQGMGALGAALYAKEIEETR
jgi:predicted CoA-substrate-specific enzyme activase